MENDDITCFSKETEGVKRKLVVFQMFHICRMPSVEAVAAEDSPRQEPSGVVAGYFFAEDLGLASWLIGTFGVYTYYTART